MGHRYEEATRREKKRSPHILRVHVCVQDIVVCVVPSAECLCVHCVGTLLSHESSATVSRSACVCVYSC